MVTTANTYFQEAQRFPANARALWCQDKHSDNLYLFNIKSQTKPERLK